MSIEAVGWSVWGVVNGALREYCTCPTRELAEAQKARSVYPEDFIAVTIRVKALEQFLRGRPGTSQEEKDSDILCDMTRKEIADELSAATARAGEAEEKLGEAEKQNEVWCEKWGKSSRALAELRKAGEKLVEQFQHRSACKMPHQNDIIRSLAYRIAASELSALLKTGGE